MGWHFMLGNINHSKVLEGSKYSLYNFEIKFTNSHEDGMLKMDEIGFEKEEFS